MESREIDRLWGERPDRRPEQLRETLTQRPRVGDVIVELHRVQLLVEKTYRLDYDVRLNCDGSWVQHDFRGVDVVRDDGRLQLPSRLVEVGCQPSSVQGLAGSVLGNLLGP